MTSFPTHLVLIAALDLAGVFFNFRLFWKCFEGRAKNTFLQKCRAFIICQCVFQVTILVANTVESWKLWHNTQPREICDVFSLVSTSTLFFQACNLTVILVHYSDHKMARENGHMSSKVKVSAAIILLGFIGSAVTVLYCFPLELLFHMALKRVSFVVTVAFIVLLFAVVSKYFHEVEASTKTFPLLWNICKEFKRSTIMLFISLLLMCLAVYLRMFPRSSFSVDYERAKFFQEVIYSVITSYVVGLCLPLSIIDVIDSSHEEEHDSKVILA